MTRSMDQLLNRSFQTTYSTFRPSFLSSYAGAGLSLVDATVYEDQLRIDEVTGAFRNSAEDQLRDLNIRVAILFEQDSINERENPFRPFLLARAVATAIDNLGHLVELNTALFDQLASELEDEIADVYNAVNAHLATHGIAAQLQLKIKKSASARADSSDQAVDSEAEPTPYGPQEGYRSASTDPHQFDTGERSLSSDQPRRRIEQLFDFVMQIARPQAMPASGAAAQPGNSADQHARDTPGNNPAPGWLGARGMADTLRNLFFNPAAMGPMRGNQGPAEAPASRIVSGQLSASIAELMNHHIPTGEAMTAGDGALRNLIFEQRAALSEITEDGNEQMTIDVVAMLFEFILRDAQVPAEVRAQLGRLQFLVLKVALRESSLLTHKSHPARLLVNRIGSISAGLKQIDPGGVRVGTEICRIVETLLADRSESSNLFETMLDEFDAFIANELRAGDSRVDLAVQAVENAQSRTLRFAHLTAQLGEVLTGLTIDPFLAQFLTTTWVHVIERAERAVGATSQLYRQLVPDLLWSIVPKFTQPDRAKLVAMLPGIVRTLRSGMQLEHCSAALQQEVLNWLVDVHSRALRSTDANVPLLTLASMHLHFEHFIANPERDEHLSDADDPETRVYHDNFLAEAMQESAAQVEQVDPLIERAGVQLGAATQVQAAELSEAEVLERLRSGLQIIIMLGDTPGNGQLNWVNQQATTLVLTMEGQPTPLMMSVRMFLRLLGLGRVQFVETAPVFERAVQALLHSAEQVEQKAAA
jgi:hypothetical protein